MAGPSSSNGRLADIGGRRIGVAVAVGDGRGQDDEVRGQASPPSAALDRIRRIVVGDRPVLLEADRAGRRIEVDGEGHRRRRALQIALDVAEPLTRSRIVSPLSTSKRPLSVPLPPVIDRL